MNDLQELTQTPNELAKRMLSIRYKRDQLRQALNTLDNEYDLIRDALLSETQKHKVLSLKTEDYTISRKKIRTIQVDDDARAISELQKLGIQPPMTVRLNWRSMGQEIYKLADQGLKYSHVKETEYIAIKKAV